MKITKKCGNTQTKISIKEKLDELRNRRRSSTGMFYTSSAGAVTSLILIATLSFLSSAFLNITGLTGTNQAHATASTLTISVTDSVALDITSINSTGTFATSDTSTNNISIKTTNGTGYTLGIKAKTNNSNVLINSSDPSKTIPSITTSISEATYSTNTAYNNTWGFRPSKLNSAANENYIQAPTSSSTLTTLDKTTSANPSTANTYNLAIGARINSSTVPGFYSNVFIITVTANPIPYTITYNKNTEDTVTNMPANTSSQTYDETVNISNQVPARDGYNFKGWCTTQTADGGTCSGTTYNPDGGGTDLAWTLDQTASSSSLSIYAMWEMAGINLYDTIAAAWVSEGSRVLTNDTDTNTGIKAAITTSNSGVFKYNPSTFGTASDAANTSDIYFYRGILDTTVGRYGSNGDNAAHPNTVILDANNNGKDETDTCWRIVRTTGSGGVKMIYQGKWTGSTCANATTNAQVATSAFSGTSSTYRQIVRIGYTHNSTYAVNTSKSGTIAQIFGSNSNPGANNTRSDIKTYIEDTWYANNMTSYTSKLEASAGYCNDRTMNTTDSWTTPLAESTTIASTYGTSYGTSGQQPYYFGAYPRTRQTAQSPSLTCGNKYSQIDRSTVDLYRYVSGSTGVSNQLKYPAALLTADEAAFAGSGYDSSTTPYHANSFLRSGSNFWFLSPYTRTLGGYASGFYLYSNGNLVNSLVDSSNGVRPAISLTSGTMAASGTGTATDPWIVNP